MSITRARRVDVDVDVVPQDLSEDGAEVELRQLGRQPIQHASAGLDVTGLLRVELFVPVDAGVHDVDGSVDIRIRTRRWLSVAVVVRLRRLPRLPPERIPQREAAEPATRDDALQLPPTDDPLRSPPSAAALRRTWHVGTSRVVPHLSGPVA